MAKIKPGVYKNKLFKYDGSIIEENSVEVLDLVSDKDKQFINCNVIMRRKSEKRMLCVPIHLLEKNINK